ncbi:MAG: hypothetical protein FWG50_01465 [Kiritimatiellaeota bacterium]|nr:hypothetical protein [Kiritimatiellota bacterium]
MRFLILMAFTGMVLLGGGCVTSRVVEDARAPEIAIDSFGDVWFNGQRVASEKLAATVVASGCPKKSRLRILVPVQRDHVLMRTITDSLERAGYLTLYVTDKRAVTNVKQ